MKNIKLLMLGGFVMVLTSCLKQGVLNIDTSASTNVVELNNTGDNLTSSGIPGYYSDLGVVKAGDVKTFNLNVQYTGPGTAPSDITVNLAIDPATLTTYNTANGTSMVVPAASIYSFPSSVVIKAGTNQTTVLATITISSAFDYNLAYALPIKITNVTAATISSNYGSSVYSFGVRNAYDGIYSYKGYSLRAGDAVLTGNFTGKKMTLLTTGATSLQFATLALWGDGASGIGIGYPGLAINTAGSSPYPVTISSSGGAINNPGYTSVYNASTKTFYISFTWGAGPAARLSTDTLTYLGPR